MAKHAFVGWVGIDRDALVVLASLLFAFGAALAARRPLASGLPWLLVIALGLLDQGVSALTLNSGTAPSLLDAGRDLALFMAAPTLLTLVGRFLPQLVSPRPDRRILIPAVWEKKAPVVEAVFRESDEEGGRKASAR